MLDLEIRSIKIVKILPFCAAMLCSVTQAEPLDARHECLIEPMIVAQVGSQVQGVIEELLVDRSETVTRGQPIALLKSTVERTNLLQAKARADMSSEISARLADLELATQSLRRMNSLYAKSMVPAQQKDEAQTQLLVATAAVNQAKENYQLLQLELIRAEKLLAQRTILSPVNGVVVEQQAFPGEFIYENPVMTVAQLNPLRVEVVLPGRLFNQFSPGDEATIYTEFDEAPLIAVVDVVDRLLDTRSGTFGVRLLLSNPDLTITSGQKCQLEFTPVVAAAKP